MNFVEILSIQAQMDYRVYVLECSNGTHYTGMTSNIEKRLQHHNTPRPDSTAYTARYGPVKLLHSWQVCCKSCALVNEKRIKKMGRDKRLRVLEQPNTFVPSSCSG